MTQSNLHSVPKDVKFLYERACALKSHRFTFFIPFLCLFLEEIWAQVTPEINIAVVFPPVHARLCQMSLAALGTLTSCSEQIPSSPCGQAGHRTAGTEADSITQLFSLCEI